MRPWNRFNLLDLYQRLDRRTWDDISVEYVSFSHLGIGMIGHVKGVSKRKMAWEELLVSLLDFENPSE
jgi:hypothetical protein